MKCSLLINPTSNKFRSRLLFTIGYYPLCFDYGAYSEIIINFTNDENNAFNTFQQYFAAILVPSGITEEGQGGGPASR